MLKYIIIYLAAMSLVTFILFGADKHKAKTHKWRIPEKTLLGLSLLGGFAGGFLGYGVFPPQNKALVFLHGDDNFSCTMGVYHIQGHCRIE